MTSEELKKVIPTYPAIKVEGERKVVISTVIRKRYDGEYYLMKYEEVYEKQSKALLPKAIHSFHRGIYAYLIQSRFTSKWILDDNQEREEIRLSRLEKK
jgi:hypothetical protein